MTLDTPGRIRTTAGFLADMERDFSPYDAFRAGLDEDRANILNTVMGAFDEAWKPFDDIIAAAQERNL